MSGSRPKGCEAMPDSRALHITHHTEATSDPYDGAREAMPPLASLSLAPLVFA
jgi:hypothetical protein